MNENNQERASDLSNNVKNKDPPNKYKIMKLPNVES